MPELAVHRKTDCPHICKNPQISMRKDGIVEPYIEFSHIGMLTNRKDVQECVARAVVTARLEGLPAPTFTQKTLKEQIKVVLRAWGTVGVKLWRDGLKDEDIASVLSQADKIAYVVVPELYAGADDIPDIPLPVKGTTEVVVAEGARETEEGPKKPPAKDLTIKDLNSMSRKDMIVELRSRDQDVPDSIKGNDAKKLLLESISVTS